MSSLALEWETIFLVETERAKRAKRTHCCTLIEIFVYIYIYSPLLGQHDLLANNYISDIVPAFVAKAEIRVIACPISLGSATLYPFLYSLEFNG